MPPYIHSPMSILGWFYVSVLGISLAYLVWLYPWVLLVIAALALIAWYELKKDKARIAALIEERKGESICEFARLILCCSGDWITRSSASPRIMALANVVLFRVDASLSALSSIVRVSFFTRASSASVKP